jgi:hypothetical protein
VGIVDELLDGADGAVRPTPVLDATPALNATLVADDREGTVAKASGSHYRCGQQRRNTRGYRSMWDGTTAGLSRQCTLQYGRYRASPAASVIASRPSRSS